VISDDEFAKSVVPGLERAVPKSKGAEIGSLLHQLGVEVGRNPYGQQARKLLLEIDPTCKDRLPKRATRRPETDGSAPDTKQRETAKPPVAAPGRKQAAAKEPPARELTEEKGRKKDKEKPSPSKRPPAVKKPTTPSKKATKKGTKKPTTRKLAKRKPR
jgi:hypothetical protein